MIQFDEKLLAEAIDDIADLEDDIDSLTDKTGNNSLYKQLEKTVALYVSSPILQRARELGQQHVGNRVSSIRPVKGRWEGDTYTAGITAEDDVVLSHEFGSGQYGGGGPYRISPGSGTEKLSFVIDGRPIVVDYVVHPGVRGRRFMQRAVREQVDQLERDLVDDAQSTIQDAINR